MGRLRFHCHRIKKAFPNECSCQSFYGVAQWIVIGWGSVGYIALHGAYGDGTANGAQRADNIEMWGSFIGPTYADGQYGTNHSNGGGTPQTTLSTRPG